jgi:hypothetical protein
MRVEAIEIPNRQNHILQITDSLTGRKVAIRIDPDDASLPVSEVLSKYFQRCPVDRFLGEKRLTPEGAETLQALQDLVYTMSDAGELGGAYPGVVFKQQGLIIEPVTMPTIQTNRFDGRDLAVVDIEIDRLNVGYDRNWVGFHRRRWDRHAPLYSDFVLGSLQRESSGTEPEQVLELATADQQIQLVRSLAKTVWESDFENYSRFVGSKLRYKAGDETVRNIIDGGGGICSEKVQALKFLTDHYGIESEYVLAGADARAPVPEEKLRELLTTFDFRLTKRYLRYWQHTALLYTIDGTSILVDATNGNIPFLFISGEPAERILGYDDKPPVTVRMAVYQDDFYYHRVSQDIPENLFFAMESWIPDIDLIQVFDNELGLYISPEIFVTPVAFKSTAGYRRLEEQYLEVSRAAGLECAASVDWTLESELGQRLLRRDPRVGEKILSARDHMIARYDEQYGPGHDAGLVLIALGNDDRTPATTTP